MPVPLPLRPLALWLRVYRTGWRGTFVSGFVGPLLYLGALGLGLGALVDDGDGPGALGGLDYVEFIGPGLLVAACMQVAVGEASYPVMGAIKWNRTYHAMLATPLGVRDVLVGHLVFIALRVGTVALLQTAVLLLFGVPASWWTPAAVPVAVLTAMAFVGPVAALAASAQTDETFSFVFRFGVVPLFLFSGTFFPLDELAPVLRPLAWATPLWHGVESARDLVLGGADALVVAAHLAYVTAWVVGGTVLAHVAFRRRLAA